jgi:hypothetical protein
MSITKAVKIKVVKGSKGQCGERLKLSEDQLTDKERRVLSFLRLCDKSGREASLAQIAASCFASQGKTRSNSWARNSLRRLVRARFVMRTAPGHYAAITVAHVKADPAIKAAFASLLQSAGVAVRGKAPKAPKALQNRKSTKTIKMGNSVKRAA